MLENGLDRCTCVKKSCERFGKCAECIEYHTTRSKKYPQPYCRREKNVLKLEKLLARQSAKEQKKKTEGLGSSKGDTTV